MQRRAEFAADWCWSISITKHSFSHSLLTLTLILVIKTPLILFGNSPSAEREGKTRKLASSQFHRSLIKLCLILRILIKVIIWLWVSASALTPLLGSSNSWKVFGCGSSPQWPHCGGTVHTYQQLYLAWSWVLAILICFLNLPNVYKAGFLFCAKSLD